MRKAKREELDSNIEEALDAGRYTVMSRYAVTGGHMETLSLCNIVKGECAVCGAPKSGGEGCISISRKVKGARATQ